MASTGKPGAANAGALLHRGADRAGGDRGGCFAHRCGGLPKPQHEAALMAASTYQRLTGRARTLAGYSQLWMAPDHLLVVRSTRFHEHYQRFAFSDIQAIIITEQPSRLALQAALGIVAVLWAVCSLTVDLAFFKWFFIVTGAIG